MNDRTTPAALSPPPAELTDAQRHAIECADAWLQALHLPTHSDALAQLADLKRHIPPAGSLSILDHDTGEDSTPPPHIVLKGRAYWAEELPRRSMLAEPAHFLVSAPVGAGGIDWEAQEEADPGAEWYTDLLAACVALEQF